MSRRIIALVAVWPRAHRLRPHRRRAPARRPRLLVIGRRMAGGGRHGSRGARLSLIGRARRRLHFEYRRSCRRDMVFPGAGRASCPSSPPRRVAASSTASSKTRQTPASETMTSSSWVRRGGCRTGSTMRQARSGRTFPCRSPRRPTGSGTGTRERRRNRSAACSAVRSDWRFAANTAPATIPAGWITSCSRRATEVEASVYSARSVAIGLIRVARLAGT